METKLYPGIPFSPPAALADNVGAGDTVIPVSDISVFPAAPNLATIGADEEAETISYAAKTATALSGCVRGVEGTARAWSAGEPIARNWTAKDHADLIAAVGESDGAAQAAQEAADNAATAAQTAQTTADNAATAAQTAQTTAEGRATMEQVNAAIAAAVSAKQDKLTGQPGQVVGFGADGAAVAAQGWSNPNLLDNWYFADPVNQRGQTEYSGRGYAVDRWVLSNENCKLQVGQGYVSLISSAPKVKSAWIQQPIENPKRYFDKILSFSALLQDGTFLTCSGSIPANPVSVDTGFHSNVINGVDLHVFKRSNETAVVQISALRTGIGQTNIVATKLELGPAQTLARQDADGNWVLNDPPPNKALELAKCQRYQLILLANNAYTVFGSGVTISNNSARIFIPTPTTIRTNPSVRIQGNLGLYDYENYPIISIEQNAFSCNGVNVTVVSTRAIETKKFVQLRANNDDTAAIILDANL